MRETCSVSSGRDAGRSPAVVEGFCQLMGVNVVHSPEIRPRQGMRITATSMLLLVAWPVFAADVTLSSPACRLHAWTRRGAWSRTGKRRIRLTTDGAVAAPTVTVRSIKLDDQIPAVEARQQQGALDCALTAFRAPAFPGSLDVLTVTSPRPLDTRRPAGSGSSCRRMFGLAPRRSSKRATGDHAACDAQGDAADARLGLPGRCRVAAGLGEARGRVRSGLPQHPGRARRRADCVPLQRSRRRPGSTRCSAGARATGPNPGSVPCSARSKGPRRWRWIPGAVGQHQPGGFTLQRTTPMATASSIWRFCPRRARRI